MTITLYTIRKMIEEHECVEEILDMHDWNSGKVYLSIKCNDKYLADILSGKNDFDEHIQNINLILPYNCVIEYDINV